MLREWVYIRFTQGKCHKPANRDISLLDNIPGYSLMPGQTYKYIHIANPIAPENAKLTAKESNKLLMLIAEFYDFPASHSIRNIVSIPQRSDKFEAEDMMSRLGTDVFGHAEYETIVKMRGKQPQSWRWGIKSVANQSQGIVTFKSDSSETFMNAKSFMETDVGADLERMNWFVRRVREKEAKNTKRKTGKNLREKVIIDPTITQAAFRQ